MHGDVTYSYLNLPSSQGISICRAASADLAAAGSKSAGAAHPHLDFAWCGLRW